jgi:hypothetical protein
MSVVKTSLGVDARGIETIEVRDADTGEIIGHDYISPDSIDE